MSVGSEKVGEIARVLREKMVEFAPRTGEQWRVRPMYEKRSKDNFASVIFIAEVDDAATRKMASFVVKIMPLDAHMREIQNSDLQFHNESIMLTTLVPKLIQYSDAKDRDDVRALFPKCYLADVHPSLEAIIVLENLTEQGFSLPGYLVDYDHCRLSLIGLAKYHAMGYAMKRRHPKLFAQDIIAPIQEVRFRMKNRAYQNHDFGYYARDPINFIMNSDDADLIEFRNKNEDFLTRLAQICQNPIDYVAELNLPQEPLATLCHGDFNRNNLLFQYEDGKPTRVKFVDFQTIRYATPGTDIVFMFYLNTKQEFRQKHLADLLSVYQRTLVDTLAAMVDAPREEIDAVYSLSALREDFERCAITGYVVCALFAHYMLASVDELEVMNERRSREEGPFTSEEYLQSAVKMGGDEAMERSVAIIREMALMPNALPKPITANGELFK